MTAVTSFRFDGNSKQKKLDKFELDAKASSLLFALDKTAFAFGKKGIGLYHQRDQARANRLHF